MRTVGCAIIKGGRWCRVCVCLSRFYYLSRSSVHFSPGSLVLIDSTTLTPHVALRFSIAGDRLAASYVNFYLANGAVILPGYDVPEDETAMRLLKVRLL